MLRKKVHVLWTCIFIILLDYHKCLAISNITVDLTSINEKNNEFPTTTTTGTEATTSNIELLQIQNEELEIKNAFKTQDQIKKTFNQNQSTYSIKTDTVNNYNTYNTSSIEQNSKKINNNNTYPEILEVVHQKNLDLDSNKSNLTLIPKARTIPLTSANDYSVLDNDKKPLRLEKVNEQKPYPYLKSIDNNNNTDVKTEVVTFPDELWKVRKIESVEHSGNYEYSYDDSPSLSSKIKDNKPALNEPSVVVDNSIQQAKNSFGKRSEKTTHIGKANATIVISIVNEKSSDEDNKPEDNNNDNESKTESVEPVTETTESQTKANDVETKINETPTETKFTDAETSETPGNTKETGSTTLVMKTSVVTSTSKSSPEIIVISTKSPEAYSSLTGNSLTESETSLSLETTVPTSTATSDEAYYDWSGDESTISTPKQSTPVQSEESTTLSTLSTSSAPSNSEVQTDEETIEPKTTFSISSSISTIKQLTSEEPNSRTESISTPIESLSSTVLEKSSTISISPETEYPETTSSLTSSTEKETTLTKLFSSLATEETSISSVENEETEILTTASSAIIETSTPKATIETTTTSPILKTTFTTTAKPTLLTTSPLLTTLTTMTVPTTTEKTEKTSDETLVVDETSSFETTTSKETPKIVDYDNEVTTKATTTTSNTPILTKETSTTLKTTTETTEKTTTNIVKTESTTDMNIPLLNDEGVTLLVRIVFEGSWHEVCTKLPEMQRTLEGMINNNTERKILHGQIVFSETHCVENLEENNNERNETILTPILVYVMNSNGNIDSYLTKELPRLYKTLTGIQFPLKIRSFDLVEETDRGTGYLIEIVSAIVIICLVLLGALLFIMRKRQTRFNYGERCRPVSLDAYSLDSVSAYNSVRRNKAAIRSSKRSYGNPTFEDSTVIPSHPLNYNGLANFVNDTNAISEEFSNIPQVSSKIEELPMGAEVKNRYANVIPLPETRVPLQRLNNDPLTEYINANYVRGPKNAMKYYIACQAPTETTVSDFWRMIWEQQSKVIIMLTDLFENGVEKCTEYIPPSEISDCHRLYGDYQVTLKKRETKEKYAISTLQLKNLENNTFREVYHVWYLWPSTATPSDSVALVSVLLESRALQRGGSGPIVVHCSPGTGRTGMLIALDLAIRQYEITRTVDVPRVVYTIRRDRAGAVQTKQQYAFIYKALNHYAAKLSGCAVEST